MVICGSPRTARCLGLMAIEFRNSPPATSAIPTTDQNRAMRLDPRGWLWLTKDGEIAVCVEAGKVSEVLS